MQSRMLPQDSKEKTWFVIFSVVIGFAWELLYRGYLLWILTPQVGVVIAVSIAAISYGLAHGYQNKKQIIGSIIAAFVFTIAFALTNSLWWLILIHSALPLMGLFSMPRSTGKKGNYILE